MVYDIVCFVCSQGILCQGCGLVVNFVVCYIIGIIEVDLVCIDLFFECFVLAEWGELFDIDVDFEYEWCEEVI